MFGLIVMLTHEFAASQVLSKWYCLVDQKLIVLFHICNFTDVDKIPNSSEWNAAPNQSLHPALQVAVDTMLHLSPDFHTFRWWFESKKSNLGYSLV